MPQIRLDEQGMPEGWPIQADWELSPAKVKAMLDAADADDADDDVVLLDCRLPREKAIAGIDGALFIPMQELADRMDELEDFAACRVVVFCHAGARSLKVARYLRERGFEDVWSMAGGIDLWSLTVDALVPRY